MKKRFRVSPNHRLPHSPLAEIKPITVYVMESPQLTPISHHEVTKKHFQ